MRILRGEWKTGGKAESHTQGNLQTEIFRDRQEKKVKRQGSSKWKDGEKTQGSWRLELWEEGVSRRKPSAAGASLFGGSRNDGGLSPWSGWRRIGRAARGDGGIKSSLMLDVEGKRDENMGSKEGI